MDPVLIDLPEQIETPRLTLRVPVPGDGAIVHPSVCCSIEHAMTDGAQSLSPEQFADMMKSIKRIALAVDREV
jgi:3-deoxy-D-arabino-heptulosonate 7-phosphate (DAHP) synthase